MLIRSNSRDVDIHSVALTTWIHRFEAMGSTFPTSARVL